MCCGPIRGPSHTRIACLKKFPFWPTVSWSSTMMTLSVRVGTDNNGPCAILTSPPSLHMLLGVVFTARRAQGHQFHPLHKLGSVQYQQSGYSNPFMKASRLSPMVVVECTCEISKKCTVRRAFATREYTGVRETQGCSTCVFARPYTVAKYAK